MVRIIIKGGVWRNTEDEILKAAISKYGKNQWARISSLLVRKTPKQCKARWYEWLDPSIKKVEWSKTEDEKLLHLAKLMPTQWRTIAPIVGRTATQCLERYQKLLDEAEAKENSELGLGGPEGGEGAPAADDIRRLKPGEIDTDPETKAARPDPIDMDEDEKEMLSEARARLANTQGKKSKRKARERQLEEARRLAALQKKRELKAAGIILRHKPKNKGMDYNEDIPFNKQPAPGFYDVTEENAVKLQAPIGQTLRQLEGKRRQDMEDQDEKRKKQKKGGEEKNQNTQFIAAREAQIQKLKDTEQIIKRRKLNLPQPQVGEAELEDIVKIGRSSRTALDLVESSADAGQASDKLIGEYEVLNKARMARTPMTAPQEDNIMAEAINLRNMTAQQTPLLGDENTPMHGSVANGTGFESATPRHQVSATPNPLATPFRGRDVSATPRSEAGASTVYAATPLRTPMRDNLSINEAGPSYGDTPREQRMRENAAKRALRQGFAALPTPENNFEFDEEVLEEEDEPEVELSEEDAAERDAKLAAARAEEERKALERRSAVVKQDLPRPVRVNLQRLVDELASASAQGRPDFVDVDQMIDYELAQLMLHDAIAHPLPGSNIPGGTISQYDMPEDEYIAAAKDEIHRELGSQLGLPGASDEQVKQVTGLWASDLEQSSAGWTFDKNDLVFSVTQRQWVMASELSEDERVKSLAAHVGRLRERMVSEAALAVKAEKRLGKQLGGYQMVNSKIKTRLAAAMEALATQEQELETFTMLRIIEEAAGPKRLEEKREEVTKLESRERDLQSTFAEMEDERRALEREIDQLGEEMMIAEAQQALEAQERLIAQGDDEMAVDDAEIERM